MTSTKEFIHKAPIWAFFVAAVIIGAISFGFSFLFVRPAPIVAENPIKLSKIEILNNVPGVKGPALHVGDVLKASYNRCNNGPIIITTAYRIWETVDPPGISVPNGNFTTPIKPGCINIILAISMPSTVIQEISGLNSSGIYHVTWRVAGAISVPSKSTYAFASESFKVVP